MESGANLFELEGLLQSELAKYKDNFREEMTKYHSEINDRLKKDLEARKPFYEKVRKIEKNNSNNMQHLSVGRLSMRRVHAASRNMSVTFSNSRRTNNLSHRKSTQRSQLSSRRRNLSNNSMESARGPFNNFVPFVNGGAKAIGRA